MALVKVYSDLVTALDSNTDSQALLALFYMTAAFDTVEYLVTRS